MASKNNETGFILLQTSKLVDMALDAIRFRIAKQHLSPLKSNEEQADLSVMRDEFLRTQIPVFLENAVLETSLESKCSRVTNLMSGTPIGQIIQTHVQPFVIFFTIITNCLTAIVLTRPSMRTPTNTLLLGIAIADLLTVLLPLPIYLSSFASNLYREQLTLFKGYAVSYLATLLPTMFHTAAIWMTVLLAVQRLIYVQHPLIANSICLCQTGPIKWLTSFTVILALLFQLPQMIFLRYHNAMSFHVTNLSVSHVPVLPSQFGPVVLDELGLVKCTPLDPRFMFSLLLCRVAFVHVIPSVSLTILTGQLIVALHRFVRNRRKLLAKSQPTGTVTEKVDNTPILIPPETTVHNGEMKSQCIRQTGRPNGTGTSEKDSTSRMMLVVLCIFLLVELPTTACICFYAFAIILNREVSRVFFETMELCNFLVVLSYPANFFVYFAMSRQFRNTFEATFPWCWKTMGYVHGKCHCAHRSESGSMPECVHRPNIVRFIDP